MGVLEPVEEAFEDEVPATPPGFRDLRIEDGSDDDLFSETQPQERPAVINFSNDLSFKNIFPVLPAKGEFDFLGVRSIKDVLESDTPGEKRNKYCSKCVEDVKKDLKKLSEVVENFRNERDAAKNENEVLKKEVEELKKLLKKKEESENGEVKVTVLNPYEGSVDLVIRKKNIENAKNVFNNNEVYRKNLPDFTKKSGIRSLSISVPNEANQNLPETIKTNSRKTVAELRREFFSKDFQSEQKTFTSSNFLEIKPEEEKKTSVRSRLTIKIKPKQKITELISKLTSKISCSKVVPEAPQITMFQRFEKTRFVWQSDAEKTVTV